MSSDRSRRGGLAAVAGIALLSLCIALPLRSDDTVVPEYQLKAEFMERFTRFIDWPPSSAVNDAQTPFIIGVIGDDPFGPYLKELAANRKIKGKRVVVRQVNGDFAPEACHMLFISSSERKQLARILARTASRPVLTVADSSGFGSSGVIINFYRSGDRIRFEVNADAAEQSGLRVGSKLLKLARVIEEGEE